MNLEKKINDIKNKDLKKSLSELISIVKKND